MNPRFHGNPFIKLDPLKAWGPASFDMALPLAKAANISPGMRVLEVGGGSGYIATTIAKIWDVSMVTLEPWAKNGNNDIQAYAAAQGVENQVLQLNIQAQSMPFADNTFDAVICIGSFEMIGDERPLALSEMIRVAKPGARIGIAEPMCQPIPMPADLVELDNQFNLGFQACFKTLEWNCNLFKSQGLSITDSYYFEEAYPWWLEYRDLRRISEAEQHLISLDHGRWLSLGLVVGEKV